MTEQDARAYGAWAEYEIQQQHLKYEYVPDFKISEMRNRDWVQVRPEDEVADPDTTAEYREAMKTDPPAPFPPVVLMHPNIIIDGNTRIAAAKGLRRKAFPAFVVECPNAEVALDLGASLQQYGGRRLSPKGVLIHAQRMIARGVPNDVIAAKLNRSAEQIRKIRAYITFDKRIADAPPEIKKLGTKIPKSQRLRLVQIQLDKPFYEAVAMAADIRISDQALSELVADVAETRSEDAAIDVIEDRRVKEDVGGSGPPRTGYSNTPAGHADRFLGGLLKYKDKPEELLDTRPTHREKAANKWTELYELSLKVMRLYDQVTT